MAVDTRQSWLPLLVAAALALSLPTAAQNAGGWERAVDDATGDAKLTSDCTGLCYNGPDPAVDLIRIEVRQNATHIFFHVVHADGSRSDTPLSSPPAFNSYLFFTVDGHVWEIVARQGEPFILVKDAANVGGDLGGSFSLTGTVDDTDALSLTWGAQPNGYQAAIDVRVFAHDEGPPVRMTVSHVWMEMYGHKGNAGTYYDRAPDTGDRDTEIRFTPILPHEVKVLAAGQWQLTSLEDGGIGPSAAYQGNILHVAYLKPTGTPTGDAGIYHAARNGTAWTFERVGAFEFPPATPDRFAQDQNTTTLMVADAANVWIADFPADGHGMDVWQSGGAGWSQQMVPSPGGQPWNGPPAFRPSLALAAHQPVILGKAGGDLAVMELGASGWNLLRLFPDADNGRLAATPNGTLHVVWRGAAVHGVADLHYATSADGWADHTLGIIDSDALHQRRTLLAPGAFALAVAPDGVPAIAWTDFGRDDVYGGPGLWSARIRNGTLANVTLVSVPMSRGSPDTYIAAAFDADGRLGIMHGYDDAGGYALVAENGTVARESLPLLDLPGLAYNGTHLASAHIGFNIGHGILVGDREAPGPSSFRQPLNGTFAPRTAADLALTAATGNPTVQKVAGDAQARASPAAWPGFVVALAVVVARRRTRA